MRKEYVEMVKRLKRVFSPIGNFGEYRKVVADLSQSSEPASSNIQHIIFLFDQNEIILIRFQLI